MQRHLAMMAFDTVVFTCTTHVSNAHCCEKKTVFVFWDDCRLFHLLKYTSLVASNIEGHKDTCVGFGIC